MPECWTGQCCGSERNDVRRDRQVPEQRQESGSDEGLQRRDSALTAGEAPVSTTVRGVAVAAVPGDRYSHKWLVAAGVTLGSVIELIDTSIVNVALEPMSANLGVTIVHRFKIHRDGSASFYCADPDGIVIQMLYEPQLSLQTIK